ncbi:MAG: zinc ribbon domain-containing protein [Firmicutes bacterium]|nr:zinc ribbon domain-containing protein [Bacillota bacterium]
MAIALIPILVTMTIILAVPVLIGVYVYQDATQRGMNAALWTLIAMLAPVLIGLIIYLLVRGNYSALKCSVCATPVKEQYVICPKCGTKLREFCANCGEPLEADWTVCPKCASSLPERHDQYTPPLRKKDTALGKVIVFLVLASLVLLVLSGVFSYNTFSGTTTGSSTSFSIEDYQGQPEVMAWINKCNEDKSKLYALRYQAGRGLQKATYYLIYRPLGNRMDSFGSGNGSGLFGSNIEVQIYESPGQTAAGDELIGVSNFGKKYVELKLSVNGQKKDCEITDVKYNPVPFD